MLLILLFGSCKNESKNKFEINIVDKSQLVKDNFLETSPVEISIPGLMGAISLIDTVGVFMNRSMFEGEFSYIEDQGKLYVDLERAKIISHATWDTSKIYYVAPMYIKPNDRKAIMSFVVYFMYDFSTSKTKQMKGGLWLEKNAQNINLEDDNQAVVLSYDIDFNRIENRLFASDTALIYDYSYRINHFLERQFMIEDEQQSDSYNKLEYSYGVFDIDSDGKEEILVLFQSSYYCGSGGCNLLILDDNYSLITETSVTMPPISILLSVHNGYNDIVVFSDGENRILKYDGGTYPQNPSLEASIKLKNIAKTIILGEESDNIGFYK